MIIDSSAVLAILFAEDDAPEFAAEIARQAYRAYGKGTGHPAQLNFGYCFAYALAKEAGEPLLFKGDGFPHTDIQAALESPD